MKQAQKILLEDIDGEPEIAAEVRRDPLFASLKRDIKAHGQATPIQVFRIEGRLYRIINGYMRCEALSQLGKTTVIADVFENEKEAEKALIAAKVRRCN